MNIENNKIGFQFEEANDDLLIYIILIQERFFDGINII